MTPYIRASEAADEAADAIMIARKVLTLAARNLERRNAGADDDHKFDAYVANELKHTLDFLAKEQDRFHNLADSRFWE